MFIQSEDDTWADEKVCGEESPKDSGAVFD